MPKCKICGLPIGPDDTWLIVLAPYKDKDPAHYHRPCYDAAHVLRLPKTENVKITAVTADQFDAAAGSWYTEDE